jgi:hypothetical protein
MRIAVASQRRLRTSAAISHAPAAALHHGAAAAIAVLITRTCRDGSISFAHASATGCARSLAGAIESLNQATTTSTGSAPASHAASTRHRGIRPAPTRSTATATMTTNSSPSFLVHAANDEATPAPATSDASARRIPFVISASVATKNRPRGMSAHCDSSSHTQGPAASSASPPTLPSAALSSAAPMSTSTVAAPNRNATSAGTQAASPPCQAQSRAMLTGSRSG